MVKKKASDRILTSVEKKEIKQKKMIALLVILIILSLAFNIVFLLNLEIPYINPNGGYKVYEITKDDQPSVIKRIFKNNSQFKDFTAIVYRNGNNIYYIEKADNMCRFKGDEGWGFKDCDFELAKWDELERILFKYQLEEYDPSNHIDPDGRIQNYKVNRELNLWVGITGYNMEIPDNIDELETFLSDLTNLAKTKWGVNYEEE